MVDDFCESVLTTADPCEVAEESTAEAKYLVQVALDKFAIPLSKMSDNLPGLDWFYDDRRPYSPLSFILKNPDGVFFTSEAVGVITQLVEPIGRRLGNEGTSFACRLYAPALHWAFVPKSLVDELLAELNSDQG